MAKPTQDVTWAKGASPNTQDPTNERPNGYPDGFQVPAAAHNWQFEAIGDWLAWAEVELDKLIRPRELEDLVTDLSVGEIGTLTRQGDGWGKSAGTMGTGFGSALTLCCTSLYYILGGTSAIQRYPRASAATSDVTYTLSQTISTLTRVVCTDRHVAIAYVAVGGGADDWVDFFSIDSGTLIWSFNAAGNIADLAIRSTGATGATVAVTDGNLLKLFTAASGTPSATVDHDALIYGVIFVGQDIVFYGASSGGAGDTGTGTDIVKLAATTGFTVAFDRAFGVTQDATKFGQITSDGSRVYVAVIDSLIASDLGVLVYDVQSLNNVTFGTEDVTGAAMSALPLPGGVDAGEAYSFVVDDSYLFLIKNGFLHVIDKVTWAEVHSENFSSGSYAGLAFDFDRLYVAGSGIAGNGVFTMSLPNRDRKMLRVEHADEGDEERGWHHLTLVPVYARSIS